MAQRGQLRLLAALQLRKLGVASRRFRLDARQFFLFGSRLPVPGDPVEPHVDHLPDIVAFSLAAQVLIIALELREIPIRQALVKD